jgi:hypothetical protein
LSDNKQETLVDKTTEKNVKKTAEEMTEKKLAAIKIPVGKKTPDEYIEEMRANNLALAQEREDYLRNLALQQYHSFPINTGDINDPYAIPSYTKSVRLSFHDVSIHQWEYYQKLKVEAEDLNRLSFTTLQNFQQTKTAVPENFARLRQDRMLKEIEQYRYGAYIFYRMSKDLFNQGDYIFIRDRVDCAEYRINNSLPFSQTNSETSSTSNNPMSDSIT